MLYDIMEWSCMIGAFLALLYTLPRLARHFTDAAVVAVSVYFACSFLSFFLGLDFVWPHLADLFGFRNITTIMIHCIVVVLTAAQQVVLVHWSYPPKLAGAKARKRVLAFGMMIIILIAMFVFALPSRRHDAETASLLNMQNPRYCAYLYLYLGVIAVGQIITMRLSVHYAGIAPRAWLRRGMWIVAAGSCFILVYCAVRYMEIIGVQSGADMERLDAVQWFAGDVGSLLELVGWTIPGWGPWLSRARRWGADYRAYRRLHPLWAVLCETSPMIVKAPQRSRLADHLPPRDPEHRLYRRVIEILDGQLALRPYLHSGDAEEAQRQARESGFHEEACQATAVALQLHAALRAKAEGQASPDPSVTFSSAPGDDLRDQVRWLTMVAEAFTRTRPARTTASASGAPRI
ncbi:MAB_1171c family putative transporter [Actinomadura terrae]|uniref:MAB_1171c family putative transporter n=1 Tax=Actinomadura terrae TaxID=604353 RepID=UPI001FA6C36B|nr:MAB_1171c family putative transporter [Actinomadura terrae]